MADNIESLVLAEDADIVSLVVAEEETRLRSITFFNSDAPIAALARAPLPYQAARVLAYARAHCAGGNNCVDNEFDLDCTHFLCHSLAATGVRVTRPSATCRSGLCIRVNDLAAAFAGAANQFPNVKRLTSHAQTRAGDFCFIPTWFGLRKEHGMLLAAAATAQGAAVYAHTNNRCGQNVAFEGAACVYYRIEDA